jgi:hypothetical protein
MSPPMRSNPFTTQLIFPYAKVFLEHTSTLYTLTRHLSTLGKWGREWQITTTA